MRGKGRKKDCGSREDGLEFGESIGGVEKSVDGGAAAAH